MGAAIILGPHLTTRLSFIFPPTHHPPYFNSSDWRLPCDGLGGSKAIEIRAVDNGQLDGVFMHKRTQKLRFLCERNDKVRHGISVMSSYSRGQCFSL